MAKAVRDEVLTTAETCRYLKVAPRTLYRYIQEKRVPAFKLGKDWRPVEIQPYNRPRGKKPEHNQKKNRRVGDQICSGVPTINVEENVVFFVHRVSPISQVRA